VTVNFISIPAIILENDTAFVFILEMPWLVLRRNFSFLYLLLLVEKDLKYTSDKACDA
jgi:hypothetical protein